MKEKSGSSGEGEQGVERSHLSVVLNNTRSKKAREIILLTHVE